MTTKHLTFIFLLFIGSSNLYGQRIRGNGNITTSTRTIENFSQLKVSGLFDVVLTNRLTQSITITTDENFLPYIISEVNADGELLLRPKRGAILKPSGWKSIKIEIPHKALSAVRLHGSGSIAGNEPIEIDMIRVKQTGSGSIDLHLRTNSVELKQTGSGHIKIQGKTNALLATNSGSGELKLKNLESAVATARMIGSGNIQLQASKDLKALVSGSGSIRYKGNPDTRVDTRINGSGSVLSY